MKTKTESIILPIILFLIAISWVIFFQLKGLTMIPGNIGDARLNNYFLENVFQFLIGGSESLWHLPFFYPFPYVLGFSDNHFGSAVVYIIARCIISETDTSYQIWFLVGYLVNYGSAFWVLRRLGASVLAASIGSLIFAFALPTSAHAGHAQLHYRFGVPLAILFFMEFLKKNSWYALLLAGFWLVWQFYSGIYMGFFALFLIGAMFLIFIGQVCMNNNTEIKKCFSAFIAAWMKQSKQEKYLVLCSLGLLLALMILLFYPYVQVSHLYSMKRTWGEISPMLPRPQSYFLSDASLIWSTQNANLFNNIPMRHEHQMFIGAIPLILAVIGYIMSYRSKHSIKRDLLAGMLIVSIVVTLSLGGFSLWYIIHNLPLASAIRAMTRIDQALLFPVAYLGALAVDQIREKLVWGPKVVLLIIVPLLMFEFSLTQMGVSSKDSWRQRIVELENRINNEISNDSVLFIAQRSGPSYADELDAMWLAMNRGVKTINGYSGSTPPGISYEFGQNCAELRSRILSYLHFIGKENDKESYVLLMSEVIPVGFDNCNVILWDQQLVITSTNREYTAYEFSLLSLNIDSYFLQNEKYVFNLRIKNSGNTSLAARSEIGRPIRLSWRFIDSEGKNLSGWDARKDILFDIPAKGELVIPIVIAKNLLSDVFEIEFSIVQEFSFWGHDVGVDPPRVYIK